MTRHDRYLIMLAIIFTLFVVGYVFMAYRIIKKIQGMYYKDVYGVTLTNIKKLASDDTNLVNYNGNGIEEIDELNNCYKIC